MDQENRPQIRTEAVKTVLASNIPMDTITACRDLSAAELEFIRVYLEMNQAPPRARRSDAGKPRTKPDTRSVAAISRGDLAQVS